MRLGDERGVAQSECFAPRESEPLASGDVDERGVAQSECFAPRESEQHACRAVDGKT
jgi:hypothetical protein